MSLSIVKRIPREIPGTDATPHGPARGTRSTARTWPAARPRRPPRSWDAGGRAASSLLLLELQAIQLPSHLGGQKFQHLWRQWSQGAQEGAVYRDSMLPMPFSELSEVLRGWWFFRQARPGVTAAAARLSIAHILLLHAPGAAHHFFLHDPGTRANSIRHTTQSGSSGSRP